MPQPLESQAPGDVRGSGDKRCRGDQVGVQRANKGGLPAFDAAALYLENSRYDAGKCEGFHFAVPWQHHVLSGSCPLYGPRRLL
jgi:hypothetical protein